jgi:flagellar motility protein MotE (MotC chaperone)
VSAGKLVRRIRLLPTVMTMAAMLLVIKGEGLIEARAQDGKGAPATQTQSAKFDPASDDAEQGSASTVDVLTSLAHRRGELDTREQELATRENLIAAAAKRVDQRIAELKALQAKLQSLLGLRDAVEQKQFDQLVKSYSSMRPKDAARIFNALSDEVLIPVAAAMKADVLGAILAQMQPEAAQKLTVKLANRLDTQRIETQATQLAALTAPPPAAQPVLAPAPAAAQPDPAQAAPAQTTSSTQSADKSMAATPMPAQSAPAQSASAQPDAPKPAAKHRARAKKLAMGQPAFAKLTRLQSTLAQTAPLQQAAMNMTAPPPAMQTPSPPVIRAVAKPATQLPQPPPERIVQGTPAAIGTAAAATPAAGK